MHVIPTAVARGAQIYARALADALDGPDTRHRVLCLFDGGGAVQPDEWLGGRGGAVPGAGFDPRVAWHLRWHLARRAPAAVVAHGGDALKYVIPGAGRVPVAYYAIGTVAAPARRADIVAAVSDDVAAECRDVFGMQGAQLVVVPNGRDGALFHPGHDGAQGEPVVAFVGRLVEGKRPEWFVRLVAEVRARGVRCRAVLVGEGPLAARLQGPAAAAGVEVLGRCDDVAAQLRQVDVLVFPSVPEGEGMPGVLIEAGLSGVPAVATDVPGVSTVVADGETGVVVGVDDFDQLVSATASLLADGDRRRAMGSAARARCLESFSLEASAARWRGLLEGLARGR